MKEPLYLLDTNVVLALIRGNELGKAIEARFGLAGAKQKPLLSVVSCGEIRVLAGLNKWASPKVAALEVALANLVIVDLNHPAILDAYVEIDIFSQKYPAGARNMGKNDLWIAACTKAAKATLLTTDKDFSHLIPGHLDGEIISLGVASA